MLFRLSLPSLPSVSLLSLAPIRFLLPSPLSDFHAGGTWRDRVLLDKMCIRMVLLNPSLSSTLNPSPACPPHRRMPPSPNAHYIKRSSEMARSSFEFETLAADTPKQTLAFFFFGLHTAHTHTQSHTNVHTTQTHAPTRTQKCTHEHTHTHTRTHAHAHQGRYKRGDICLIKSPTHPDKVIVKRLVPSHPFPSHALSCTHSLAFSLSPSPSPSPSPSVSLSLDLIVVQLVYTCVHVYLLRVGVFVCVYECACICVCGCVRVNERVCG